MNLGTRATLIGLLAGLGLPASAAIVIDGGPAWGTPPINTAGSGSGSVVNGGNTYVYTAAASSPVASVYFGLWSGGGWGFSGNGPGITGAEAYAWFADTGNSIEYRGRTTVPTITGAYQLFTRLILTANSGATVVSDMTTQALSGDVHSLFMLTGGNFSVTREVELSLDGQNWSDAQAFYNGLQFKLAGNSYQNNLSTGFYWQNQVQTDGRLPEPGSLALAAVTLLGLASVRRIKR